MKLLARRIAVLLASVVLVACSGKGAPVGAVVATAVTLKAIQVAREKKTPQQLSKSSQGDCCTVCTECTFPCGNDCVPNGTLCTRPRGCACTSDQSIPDGTPPREANPINCNTSNPTIQIY